MGQLIFRPVLGNDIRNPSDPESWKAKVRDGWIKLTGSQNRHLQVWDEQQQKFQDTLHHCLYVVTNKPGVHFDGTAESLKLYIHPDSANFKHDMFVVDPQTRKGAPVLCAGHMTISKRGRIKAIDTDSGHYQPNINNLRAVLSFFRAYNLFSSEC